MNEHLLQEFKPRVYGILEWQGVILVSHESYLDNSFCKLPGGGMELGESPSQCLCRELREELGVEPSTMEQCGVSDVLVQNRFNPSQQVIGVYYRFSVSKMDLEHINRHLHTTFSQGALRHIKREWILKEKLVDSLSFEMDRNMATILFK